MSKDNLFNDIISKVQNKYDNDSLSHVGVLGMKWGRRKGPLTASQIAKKKQKEAKQRAKILASPSKLYKNRHKFTDAEIETAMKRMRLERELRSLSRDKLSTGSQYVQALLGYGNTAKSVYDLYKSPIGQTVVNKILKK